MINILKMLAFWDLPQKKYVKNIEGYSFYDNKFVDALPQTIISKIVMSHFETPTNDGKEKKALIIGYDGARADAVAKILAAKKMSGVKLLKEQGGGIYIGFTGGLKNNKATRQATSTHSGWATVQTGVWADLHKVKDNDFVKSNDTLTFVTRLAKLTKANGTNYNTIFNDLWDANELIYQPEVEYIEKNQISAKINRLYKEGAEFGYIPADTNFLEKDRLFHEVMLQSVKKYDITFGIYEQPDCYGHNYGKKDGINSSFSIDDENYLKGINTVDSYAFELINSLKKRESYKREDWLIIIASDHGGHKTWHGEQINEDRTVLIASNKKIKI